jgi:N-acyl-D-amino-acid deacylase
MSYDLSGPARAVDETGRRRRRAEVALHDGKIAEIGRLSDSAKRLIDASAVVVAPGCIDPHTRCDAQICWDWKISSSFWHEDEVNGARFPARSRLPRDRPFR